MKRMDSSFFFINTFKFLECKLMIIKDDNSKMKDFFLFSINKYNLEESY